jgi:putative spermidine/putrescine transport system permease protein
MIVPRIVLGVALFLFYIRINRLGYQLFGSIEGLVMGHAILSLPIVIVVISANLLSIDPSIEEAAMDLGANAIKSFLFITLPQMRVGLIVAALFAFITSFDEVDVSLFLTRPSNNTLPIEMFVYAENYQDPTLAAISALLIGFSVVLVIVAIYILRTQEYRRLLERK